jgi:hypothetical protein
MMSRDYLLPFLILPSPSLTLLSLHLLIPIQNDGALGSSSNDDELVRWRKTTETAGAPVMEHAERYGTTGSCGRAARVVEQEERKRRKPHDT